MNWWSNLFKKKALEEPVEASSRIYLDHASATPVLPEVRESMESYWSRDFHNPSAIYKEGLKVKREVEQYRTQIARALGVGSKEIIFTGSGTESVNLAILGIFERAAESVKKPHVIISSIEHPAVTEAAEEVVRRGGEMTVVGVDENGVINLEELEKSIKKSTVLVSISLASSEIGTVEPIAKIGRLVKEKRKAFGGAYPLLHTDGSAAPSYLNTNLESLQCDLLTLDAAKIYGPKGIGLLALRRGVDIHPLIFGGSQERGRRAGTLNTPLIAGFAKAFEIAVRDREAESGRLELLRQEFILGVQKNLPEALINGSEENHLPNILSISVPGILAELVVLKMEKEGVLASVGTACSTDEKVSGSPVIVALGRRELSESTIRFSFGKFSTQSDLNRAREVFCRTCSSVVKYS